MVQCEKYEPVLLWIPRAPVTVSPLCTLNSIRMQLKTNVIHPSKLANASNESTNTIATHGRRVNTLMKPLSICVLRLGTVLLTFPCRMKSVWRFDFFSIWIINDAHSARIGCLRFCTNWILCKWFVCFVFGSERNVNKSDSID